MTPEQAVERVQRSVLDGAGHRDVTVEQSQGPDFTSRTDADGQVWPENFRYYSALGEWTTITDANGDRWDRHSFTLDEPRWVSFPLSSPILPTPEEYADAERLLRGRGGLDTDAALLRCWIADTKPLAVKAGWNRGEVLAQLVHEAHHRAAPRPSLWTRTPDWAIGAAALVLVVALCCLPLVTR